MSEKRGGETEKEAEETWGREIERRARQALKPDWVGRDVADVLADAERAIADGKVPSWHLEELDRCDREDTSVPEPWDTARAHILATLAKRRRSP